MEIQFSVRETKNVAPFKNVVCMILCAVYLKTSMGKLYLRGLLLYFCFVFFSSILINTITISSLLHAASEKMYPSIRDGSFLLSISVGSHILYPEILLLTLV